MYILLDIFQYGFMVRALLAGLIVAVIAPLIGSFLVVRRLSLITDALSHVALTGVALGLLVGINPLITTLIATLITAYLIELIRENKHSSVESILAMVLPGGLALALIIISVANGFNTNLFTYLFGSITTVTEVDVWTIFIVGIGIVGTVFTFYRQITYSSFDEESAGTSGIPVRLVNHIFMMLTALTVAIAMKIVGALLIGALMVVPVITAMNIVRGFKASIFASIVVALLSVMLGLISSYYANLPAGASIVAVAIIFYFFSLIRYR